MPKSERSPKSESQRPDSLQGYSDLVIQIYFGFRHLDFGFFHCVPCAVANSRRVKTMMPNRPRIPPKNRMIWPNALPNSNQVMLRPVLRESMGEKFLARLITHRMALKVGMTTTSAGEEPLVPFSGL